MIIRRAELKDTGAVMNLLGQVLSVHHTGRPDLFKAGVTKYTEEELAAIFNNPETPVFVAEEDGNVSGYVFCIFQQKTDDNILTGIKTLYVDDLCVDESMRGRNVGKRLFEYVRKYAAESGCHNLTLNVWACNEGARKFYEKCGLVPQKYGMEVILK